MAKYNYTDGDSLFQMDTVKAKGPVECLGLTFPDDNARREHFLGILREKLKDPAFRKIEGFPIGSDEVILALSDPPYYTACPNPFITDFVKFYGKPYDPNEPYSREPFAADVSEGKNDPIYNAHSYHTKVPHKAIMRYILHYTEPGDVVFDGFCGTGMTGVAAQMCGDKAVVESLGYRVDKDGTIRQQETDETGKTIWKPFSKLGARRAVLNDLSPAATFIAYNYNTPVDVRAFEREARRILREVEDECGWMYETLHTDGKTKGRINYTIWSDVFVCPECTREVIFWDAAVDKKVGSVRDEFPCPYCGAMLTKRRMDRVWVSKYDSAIKQTIRQAKRVPVLINYTANGRRSEKEPDEGDLSLLMKIDNTISSFWLPTNVIPKGDKTGEPLRIGITHVHHFYTKRNLLVLAALWDRFTNYPMGKLAITSVLIKTASLLHNIGFKNGKINLAGALPNALFIPSNIAERNLFELVLGKFDDFVRANLGRNQTRQLISTVSLSAGNLISKCSTDYVFVDPPFGSNLFYSELSFIWEAWLGVLTNNRSEAIESHSQNKSLNDYRILMTSCFKQAYQFLKPGRWITVEFSNTSAAVWNSIQTALSEAGFVVGNVAALNKGQGTFNSQTNPTSVKQDLIISAYKPNGGFEDRFQQEATTEEGVWDFVRTHLKYLPVVKRGTNAEHLMAVTERDPRILYDQMVAYYVRKAYPVPLNSADFQSGLSQRFSYRDGMYFLPEQAVEYDKKKLGARGTEQISLFVSDESSAIAWLRQVLSDRPSSFQDIHPMFIKELAGWQKYEKPLELSELLDQNFLRYDGKADVPNQIHSYLSTNFKELRNLTKDDERLRTKAKDRWYVPDPNKAGDLEKLRERALLREFEEYQTSSQKRLKVFRLEAVRAGFKKAWQERHYAIIIDVAQKIPENILQEDPKLLMWYDQAMTRME